MIVLSSIEQRRFNKSLACLLIILLSVLLYLRAGIAERGAGAGANSYTAAYESFLDDLVGTNSFQFGLRTVSSRGNEQNHMQTTPSSEASITDAKYVLGFSTGHAGSTSVHHHLANMCQKNANKKGEPKSIAKFEFKRDDPNAPYDADDPCKYARETLVPALEMIRSEHNRFFDLGHFHNFYPNLECLALIFGPDVAFVRIRRNRYDTARSFSSRYETPCTRDDSFKMELKNKAFTEGKSPHVSYCPLNRKADEPPVALQIEEWKWRLLNKFQKFLWMVDDLEVRWEFFKRKFARCRLIEITWSSSEELVEGMRTLDELLGCNTTWDFDTEQTDKRKEHISHEDGTRSCRDEILADLDYRRLMNYDINLTKLLFQDHGQVIHKRECIEDRTELQGIIEKEIHSLEDFDWDE